MLSCIADIQKCVGFATFRAKLLLFQEAIFSSMINDCVELSKVGSNSLKLLLCAMGHQRESVELDLQQENSW